jgi:hypothetical protein
MTPKFKIASFLAACTVLILVQTAWPMAATADTSWLYGYWHVIAGEDNRANADADWNEFRADGTYVNISPWGGSAGRIVLWIGPSAVLRLQTRRSRSSIGSFLTGRESR